MPTPVVVAALFAYIGLGGVVMNFIIPEIGYSSRRAATILFGFTWIFGWIWLVGSLAMGSARGGLQLLRWWIAIYGGLAIAVAPFALLPHPITVVIGAILGVAFGSFVASGKITWLDF